MPKAVPATPDAALGVPTVQFLAFGGLRIGEAFALRSQAEASSRRKQ
jgi:hypothetical protein